MSGLGRMLTSALRVLVAGPDGHRLDLLALLMPPDPCDSLVERRRAALITSRVRFVAALFAVLTPMWSFVDAWFFGFQVAGYLALLRIAASAAFAFLAAMPVASGIVQARLRLIGMMLIPMVFFALSHPVINTFSLHDSIMIVQAGYAFLPFIMVAGLAVFPLAAAESLLLAMPMLLLHLAAGFHGSVIFPFESYLGALWLLVLLSFVAAFAAMSQMHFLMSLVGQTSCDRLTGTLVRRDGEELVAAEYARATAAGGPFAVAFVDLDHFKQVNDRFGHEEGDQVLRNAAEAMRGKLRRSDLIVRWGGEEFLVVMPGTDARGAAEAMTRLCDYGFGQRPDGSRQTASIGIAEAVADRVATLESLIEIADGRMYEAKHGGRNRIVGVSAP